MPPRVNPDCWKTMYEVDERTNCWNWTGYKNDGGYGIISQGRGNRFRAHRFVYERVVGPIPAGLELDHKCRNPGCINPRHMDPTTHKINTRRGDMGVHNLSKTYCNNGHEFTPENTIVRRDGRGRQCRACGQKDQRERLRQKRARYREDPHACNSCGSEKPDDMFNQCEVCRSRARRAKAKS